MSNIGPPLALLTLVSTGLVLQTLLFTMRYSCLLQINFSLLLILILLIISGNVHLNPGPFATVSNSTRSLSICHINIQSLRYDTKTLFNLKLELIRNEIAEFYDIITISEYWLNDSDDLKLFEIDGFQPPFTR